VSHDLTNADICLLLEVDLNECQEEKDCDRTILSAVLPGNTEGIAFNMKYAKLFYEISERERH
jgi:hypothetical protein